MTSKPCDCSCTDAVLLLSELLDGECTPAAQEKLRAKIASCPHCFEKLGVEEEIRAILRRSCAESAPVTLRRRISVSIRLERG
ncbi:Anti-sigma factor RshA [Corynebacterium kalinowskii]|uniref:Anti-sigma factor RshA n=1 Tax=Corynebacterium kalinowskii TaxID=2675216 RepID=A0A6B8VZB0_9CORY|nr:mycothiol system anti-sigma-R factor [Corynebacterium kalinowskii]QGU02670.1 Anti-sigma factor RshA [Corynebacterium kalinowskii]